MRATAPSHRPRIATPVAILRLAGALLASCLLGACTLPHYRTIAQVSPQQALNLQGHDPALDAVVHTVIVNRGPGAWKSEAWWDEYVVSATNRSDAPIELIGFALEDFTGQATSPGNDPWKLERESQHWWQTTEARATGRTLALGAGATAVGVAAYAAGALGATSFSGAMVMAGTAFVAVPVVIVGSVVHNRNQKHKIAAEFQRRRLVLPRTLKFAETVRGSLFFRVSPGPQRLVVHFREGSEEKSLAISLEALAGLHFLRRDPSSGKSAPPETPR